jgi:3-deoxy-D-manno-octulosonate 8-phosphate phosphatase (KDO 8-P phosphatase)
MPRARQKIPSARWARIRLFAMDVDGVLTDGSLYVSSDGSETKRFSIRDGLGLKRVHALGIPLAWISGRVSGATTVRATDLQIPHVIQGQPDKLAAVRALAGQLGLALADCAYMGDDIIDVAALAAVGIGISVPDAVPAARAAADYVTRAPGGLGAVREVCDCLVAARGGLSGNKRGRRATTR